MDASANADPTPRGTYAPRRATKPDSVASHAGMLRQGDPDRSCVWREMLSEQAPKAGIDVSSEVNADVITPKGLITDLWSCRCGWGRRLRVL